MSDSLETLLIQQLNAAGVVPGSEPKRWFHGRGGQLPALDFLNLDWLPGLLLITCYRDSRELCVQTLTRRLLQRFGSSVACICIQRRYLKPVLFESLYGELPETLVQREAGLSYRLSFNAGLHTGFFLDMANARCWVRETAAERRVLNLFAYTCAFSVAALAGGAQSVVNVDMSKNALRRGRENHRINGLDSNKVQFLAHDIFRSWSKLRKYGPYDLIIIDPPSYQPGSFVAAKDYVRVIRRLSSLLADQGDVLACLNDPSLTSEFLRGLFAQEAQALEFQRQLDNPAEFVEKERQRSLKVLHFAKL